MAKQTFTEIGTSTVTVTSRHGVSYFATISGTASARVEIMINDEWKPLTAAITASTATVTTVPIDRGSAANYRWNVTACDLNASVITYLE